MFVHDPLVFVQVPQTPQSNHLSARRFGPRLTPSPARSSQKAPMLFVYISITPRSRPPDLTFIGGCLAGRFIMAGIVGDCVCGHHRPTEAGQNCTTRFSTTMRRRTHPISLTMISTETLQHIRGITTFCTCRAGSVVSRRLNKRTRQLGGSPARHSHRSRSRVRYGSRFIGSAKCVASLPRQGLTDVDR